MTGLERIHGMQEVICRLPEEYRYWRRFGNLLMFHYEQCFDTDKLEYIYNIIMKLTDNNNQYRITLFLKNVSGDVSFTIHHAFSGLTIHDRKAYGYENEAGFYVASVEQDDSLAIYCEEITVTLEEKTDISS